MVHSSPNNAKSGVRLYQVCYLHTTHLGVLKTTGNSKGVQKRPTLPLSGFELEAFTLLSEP